MNIILYAIPGFFLLIGIELLLEKVRKTNYYRVNDAIASLLIGVLSRMIGIFKALIPFTIYILLYENAALFTLPDSLLMWVTAFVVYDFFYYWKHRYGHEMSILWAAHVVHHSSEDYNLTTALRQTSSSFLNFIFYLPMALLGFEPLVLISVAALNLVYQFWVHTQHVPKLGVIEWLLVTPSNHRVHHAQNQRYLDKNYGGVFIIWDRLFGTFMEEDDDEKPIFGVRKALHSWNPLYANFQVYSQLCQDSYHTKKWSDKWRVWFGRTGWRPADVMQSHPLTRVDLATFKRFDPQLSVTAKLYCLVQYALTTLVAVLLMINVTDMPVISQLSIAFAVVYSCVSIGMFMESRPIGLKLEWLKNAAGLLALSLVTLPTWLFTALLSGILVSMLLLLKVKHAPRSDVADLPLRHDPS